MIRKAWLVNGHLLLDSSPGLPFVSACILISSFKDTSLCRFGPTHMTSFYGNYSLKALLPNTAAF